MNAETKKQILHDMTKKAIQDALDKIFEATDLMCAVMPEERSAFVVTCGRELISVGIMQTVVMSALVARQCLRKDGRDGDEKEFNRMMDMVRVSLMDRVVKTYDETIRREKEEMRKETQNGSDGRTEAHRDVGQY